MGSHKILEMPLGRRLWPRQLMLISARLLTIGGDRAVRIRDLSRGGARVEGSDLPEPGTDILLKRGRFEAFGTMAWVADNHGGIQFETSLDDDMLAAIEEEDGPANRAQSGFGRKVQDHGRWSDGSGWIRI
jgi:hypothetical protein